MDDFPSDSPTSGRSTPDHDLADLPADQGDFTAQHHEDGAAWREQTSDIARVSRHPRSLLAAVAVIGIVGVLAAVLHGLLGQNGVTPPVGWQTRKAPTDEQFASYAVSPDVPGLIVACIGDQTPHVSAGELGPAHIWRSRDAGRHWQQLAVSGFIAGCDIALPAGGRGAVVVLNDLGTEEYVAVSRDAGDTWKTVASESGVLVDGVRSTFYSLATGIYRDERLYALTPTKTTFNGQLDGFPANVLAYTPDDGATWRPIETTPDPLGAQGYLALTSAADYRAPGAWFRVLARGPYAAQSGVASPAASPAAYLQHSTDDGRTWTTLGPIGPGGSTGAARYFYELGSAVHIASTPSQPSRICAAFVASQLTRMGAAARASGATLSSLRAAVPAAPAIALGPPYREPLDVAIEASNDGGRTWTGGTIVHHQYNEGFVGGAALDQRGDCYLADNATGSKADGTPTSDATIWQLRPEQADARPAYRISGQSAQLVGVTPSSGGRSAELVASVETSQPPVFCIGGVCPGYTPHPNQLFAVTLP
jgi:hypothetical protein